MTLDESIIRRQSVRQYDPAKTVTKELLEAVIEAGRQAPFAGMTQRGVDNFRHFFVIRRSSPVAPKIFALVRQAQLEDAKLLDEPGFAEKYPAFAGVLKGLSTKEIPLEFVFSSEWTILIAERKGYPIRDEECLGCVQAFMSLKAAELGLGSRICSSIHSIRDTAALAALLGLEGDYAFDGLNIGWPPAGLAERTEPRPVPVRSVTYFE